nr:HipA domain-containing protein [Microbacterium sp. CFBP 8794]
MEGIHAGQFARADDGVVTFTYSEDASATPISLSLPREGGWTRGAPANLLDNLVPDREHARRRMAEVYGASGTGTFDLLQKAGGDVAGGLVLLPEGEMPSAGPARLNPALDRDVADRINSIKLDPDAWAPKDVPARFSLAGTQGKFALARIDADWYWSNESVPSTHILKPGKREHRDLELAEVATLTLAADVGVPAPKVAILHAYDQTAFIVERFDRAVTPTSLLAKRLHAEDLAQSIGLPPGEKYGVTAEQIVGKLREVDDTGSLARVFIQQLAFNVLVGNADAHAKNYSVLLRPDGVSLAPIYDVVPVGLYPSFEQELAMRVSGARYPQAVSRDHWRKFARRVAIDPDEVMSIVSHVAAGMAEMNETAWAQLDEDHVEVMRATVERNTSLALTEPHRART